MRLVVVTPAYNAARHLRGVVDRLLQASPPDLVRIVLVDDGSRAHSASVSAVRAPMAPPVVSPMWHTTMSAPALAMSRALSSEKT